MLTSSTSKQFLVSMACRKVEIGEICDSLVNLEHVLLSSTGHGILVDEYYTIWSENVVF